MIHQDHNYYVNHSQQWTELRFKHNHRKPRADGIINSVWIKRMKHNWVTMNRSKPYIPVHQVCLFHFSCGKVYYCISCPRCHLNFDKPNSVPTKCRYICCSLSPRVCGLEHCNITQAVVKSTQEEKSNSYKIEHVKIGMRCHCYHHHHSGKGMD